jgi:hypothetical protein
MSPGVLTQPCESCGGGHWTRDHDDAARDPVTHWTPEEHFYAECGATGIEGDTGTLNEDQVTCPACRAAPAFDGDRLDDFTADPHHDPSAAWAAWGPDGRPQR